MTGRRKRSVEKSGSGESGSGRWMLTYLDMVTLLFGVFVIMYAMSKQDEVKVKAMGEALAMAFHGGSTSDYGPYTGGSTIMEDLLPQGLRTEERKIERLKGLMQRHLAQERIGIKEDKRGIVIYLMGTDSFAPGDASLSVEQQSMLTKLAMLLPGIEHPVRLEGFTDGSNDLPQGLVYDPTIPFTSDWELGAARATSVALFLQQAGVDRDQIEVVSHGSARPTYTAGTPESRALNRRVEIVIVVGEKYERRGADDTAPVGEQE